MFDELKGDDRFQGSYNEKYFEVIKRLKSLQKAEAYLEPKRGSFFVTKINGLLFS